MLCEGTDLCRCSPPSPPQPGASFPPSEPPGLAFPKNPPGSADTDPVRPALPAETAELGGVFRLFPEPMSPRPFPPHPGTTTRRFPGHLDIRMLTVSVTCQILRRDLRRRPRGKLNSSPKETPTDLGFLGINQPKWDLYALQRGAGIAGGFWPFPCSCWDHGGGRFLEEMLEKGATKKN